MPKKEKSITLYSPNGLDEFYKALGEELVKIAKEHKEEVVRDE